MICSKRISMWLILEWHIQIRWNRNKGHDWKCVLFEKSKSQYILVFQAWRHINIIYPLYRGEIYCFTHRSFVRHISFVRSLGLPCRRSNTRHWPNVGLLLTHRLRRWANIRQVLNYRVVFDSTLNVSQRNRRRANINPALASSGSYCTARARPISIGLKVWRTNKRLQPDILAT